MTEDCMPQSKAPGLTASEIMVSCPISVLESTTSMLTLDDWQSLRWLHSREGKSIRWIAKHFGLNRCVFSLIRPVVLEIRLAVLIIPAT